MKKLRTLLPVFLSAFVALIAANAGYAFAASTPPAEFVVDVPEEFFAASIASVGDGRYCVSGYIFHDDVPNNSAMVVLVDAHARRVLWKTDIPYAKDHYENSSVDCVRSGEFYYVLTQERTDSLEAQSDTLLVMSKISSAGKLLKSQRVDVGRDVWPNLFQAGPEGLSLVGGASTDSIDRGGKRSLFVAHFDRDLSRTQLVVLPTGAFWDPSYAKLDGTSLTIAGGFLPNEHAKGAANEGYAVSKIDLSRARYVWSTFVAPPNRQAQGAVSLPDGSMAYVGVGDDRLLLSVIDASGHVARRLSAPRTICSVDALGVKDGKVQIVGTRCGETHSMLLLDIDPTSGTVLASRDIGDGAGAVSFDDDAVWMFVGKPGSDRKLFRRVAR